MVFQVGVCAHCGGEARILAFVTEPQVVRRILAHLVKKRVGRLVPYANESPGSFSRTVRNLSGIEGFHAPREGDGRFVPARLVGALGGFALSRPGRRAIKVLVWDARR